jgi:hypothetical protein
VAHYWLVLGEEVGVGISIISIVVACAGLVVSAVASAGQLPAGRQDAPSSLLVFVRDTAGRPIAGARIDENDGTSSFHSTQLGVTDSTGQLLVRPISPGCHRIVTRHLGYTPAIWSRVVRSGADDTLFVVLPPLGREAVRVPPADPPTLAAEAQRC